MCLYGFTTVDKELRTRCRYVLILTEEDGEPTGTEPKYIGLNSAIFLIAVQQREIFDP